MKVCRIFAGGVIPETSFIYVNKDDLVICADSGLKYALQLGISPDIVVGDFDSYNGQLPENTELHVSCPEKDDTDTMLAVKIAIDRGAKKIFLYGGLGARFDHSMANIQTLIYAREHGCEMIIDDTYNEISLQGEGRKTYHRREEWYFSIFALSDEVEINYLTGVKYPLEDYKMTRSFPIGVSNEITGERAILDIKSGLALVIRAGK